MAELTSLRNIGKEMDKKLKAIGITTAEELSKTGSKEAYIKLHLQYSNLCLNHLYTLEGAITDTEYNLLPEDVKKDLKEFRDDLKQ